MTPDERFRKHTPPEGPAPLPVPLDQCLDTAPLVAFQMDARGVTCLPSRRLFRFTATGVVLALEPR